MRKMSRLWKRLGLSEPLISVWTEHDSSFSLDDHDIASVTINRGAANGVFGAQEHTIEIQTIVSRQVRTGYPIHCDLTASGEQHIESLLGSGTGDFRSRYFGRIGRQTADDNGGIADPSRWHTTLYGSKWQTQLRNSDRIGNQIDGVPLMYLFDHFMSPPIDGVPYLPQPDFPSPNQHYGQMVNDYELGEAHLTYSDFARKYLEAPGYYVQNTREGRDRILTIEKRWADATAGIETQLPLSRAQVLAPAQWDQPNEDRPHNHQVKFRDATGAVRTRTVGPAPNDVRIPVTEHDVSYLQFPTDDQPVQMNRTRYADQRTDTGYRIPTLEIDLLRLIDSQNRADRIQAHQLLKLEMGDPVFLSNDWNPYLRGIHFATGITERITAAGWNLTLSLMPSGTVVGYWPPEVPPRVWDSFQHDWKLETRWWDGPASNWEEYT